VITSIGGDVWIKAAKAAAKALKIEIATVTIGAGCNVEDPFNDWARAREIDDDGCLLVRPDQHVAFRAKMASKRASAELLATLQQILGIDA
jgi:2,4-dichlorophenol 6-monooxygenase